ncbi:hypothetical protein Tsp_10706, partial [Trichinella spiralis]
MTILTEMLIKRLLLLYTSN